MNKDKLLSKIKIFITNQTIETSKIILNDISNKYNIDYKMLYNEYIEPLNLKIEDEYSNLGNEVKEKKIKTNNELNSNSNTNIAVNHSKCYALTKDNIQCSRNKKYDLYCGTHKGNLKYGTLYNQDQNINNDIINNDIINNDQIIEIQTSNNKSYYSKSGEVYEDSQLTKCIGYINKDGTITLKS